MAKKLASCNCVDSFGRLVRQYVSKDADWADDKYLPKIYLTG